MGHLGDDFFAVTLPSLNLKSSQFELYSNVVIIYNVDSEEIENVFESMVESPVGKTEKQEYSIDKKIPDKESAWDVIYDGFLRPGTLEGEQGFNKLVKLGKGILIQAPQMFFERVLKQHMLPLIIVNPYEMMEEGMPSEETVY